MDDGFLQIDVFDEIHVAALSKNNLNLTFGSQLGWGYGVIGKWLWCFVDMAHAGFIGASVAIMRHFAPSHIFQHWLAMFKELIR